MTALPYDVKRLQSLLEGLECQNVEYFITEATPEDCRKLGEAYVKKVKKHIDAYAIEVSAANMLMLVNKINELTAQVNELTERLHKTSNILHEYLVRL